MNTFIRSLFYGVIAAAGALVVQFLVVIAISIISNAQTNYPLLGFGEKVTGTIILMAVIEELFKFLLVYKIIEETKNKIKNALLPAWIVGLGFGLTEGTLSLFSHQEEVASILPNILEVTALHILIAGVIGYLILSRKKLTYPFIFTTVALAAFFHILYNIAVIKSSASFGLIIALFFIVLFALNVYNLLSLKKALHSH